MCYFENLHDEIEPNIEAVNMHLQALCFVDQMKHGSRLPKGGTERVTLYTEIILLNSQL